MNQRVSVHGMKAWQVSGGDTMESDAAELQEELAKTHPGVQVTYGNGTIVIRGVGNVMSLEAGQFVIRHMDRVVVVDESRAIAMLYGGL